jgi:hypothetical protein
MKFCFLILIVLNYLALREVIAQDVSLSNDLDYLKKKDFQILNSSVTGDGPKINHVEIKYKGLYIDLEIISPIEMNVAQAVINNNIFMLLRSFEATPTPYVGQITKVQECSSLASPQVTQISKNNLLFKFVSFNSDESLRPGVCLGKNLVIEVCQTLIYSSDRKSLLKLKSSSKSILKCSNLTKKFLKEIKF